MRAQPTALPGDSAEIEGLESLEKFRVIHAAPADEGKMSAVIPAPAINPINA